MAQGTETLLTFPQVARELGVADETVRTWVKQGHVPYVTLPGGGRRITRAQLDTILTERTHSDG
jgi:excisionase family DNA binding protein